MKLLKSKEMVLDISLTISFLIAAEQQCNALLRKDNGSRIRLIVLVSIAPTSQIVIVTPR